MSLFYNIVNSEEFPGQIDQLNGYIRILETEQYELLQQIRQLKDHITHLESQVFGGTTK